MIALTIMLCLSNCTNRLTDFTVISTKNVPVGNGHPVEFKKGSTRVKGKDTAHWVLFIPFGTPNLKDAIDRAIESTPGCIGLVDGVVKSNAWWAILYGQSKYIVEGTPLFDASVSYQNDTNKPAVGFQPVQNNYQPAQNNYHQNIVAVPTNQGQVEFNTSSTSADGLVFSHTVKEGESLVDIAKAYGVTVANLIKWNKLNNNNLVKGQILMIFYSE